MLIFVDDQKQRKIGDVKHQRALIITAVILAIALGGYLLFRGSPASAKFGPCVGAADCKVCKTCAKCKHCRAGGTCGVKDARKR